ncbi:hypothetical protein [Hymenobacter sp.]|jgi:hypothetical protein|uniref:hypothetical protein n=1 Tax=Hymenobacter sp. TaxID=1898978 RepID=UPI002ED88035
MKPFVKIEEHGRSGSIMYTSEAGTITVIYEFGGGDCVAIIYIPEGEEWVESTTLPLDQPNMVVNYIANYSIQHKAKHCRAELQGAFLYLMQLNTKPA